MSPLLRFLVCGWLGSCLGGCATMRPVEIPGSPTIVQSVHVGDLIAVSTEEVKAYGVAVGDGGEGLYFLNVTAINSDFLEGEVTAPGKGSLVGKYPRKHDLVRVPIARITVLETRQSPDLGLKEGVGGLLAMTFFALVFFGGALFTKPNKG